MCSSWRVEIRENAGGGSSKTRMILADLSESIEKSHFHGKNSLGDVRLILYWRPSKEWRHLTYDPYFWREFDGNRGWYLHWRSAHCQQRHPQESDYIVPCWEFNCSMYISMSRLKSSRARERKTSIIRVDHIERREQVTAQFSDDPMLQTSAHIHLACVVASLCLKSFFREKLKRMSVHRMVESSLHRIPSTTMQVSLELIDSTPNTNKRAMFSNQDVGVDHWTRLSSARFIGSIRKSSANTRTVSPCRW